MIFLKITSLKTLLSSPHLLTRSKFIYKKYSHSNLTMVKNNQGFSLVELMIVVGLLGGLSLVAMNLTKQSTKSSSKYQFDSEVMLITNEIHGMLSDPNKCLTTFTNATQAASPALPVLNATPSNETSPSGIASIPSTTRKYSITGGPYGNARISIASYSLNLTANPDPLLTINFKNKSILGAGTISKTIKLYVEKNGLGVITQCRSLSSSSTEIWSRGTGSDINYNGGKVGIGTNNPTAKLEVAGGIKPGPATIGGACSPEGTFAYDMAAHAPVYCSNTGSWTAMGGGGGGGVKGFFQTEGGGCYIANTFTGGCSCPAGTSAHQIGYFYLNLFWSAIADPLYACY